MPHFILPATAKSSALKDVMGNWLFDERAIADMVVPEDCSVVERTRCLNESGLPVVLTNVLSEEDTQHQPVAEEIRMRFEISIPAKRLDRTGSMLFSGSSQSL
ncbi:hypothetical protein ACJRO7_032125 [Eucalyptus globulus]|uniref:Uncharacterized protein n=1 Tax=Eucalyptus globulus TaxID=34317 RepID=A0ABD3JIA2_EUCGL